MAIPPQHPSACKFVHFFFSWVLHKPARAFCSRQRDLSLLVPTLCPPLPAPSTEPALMAATGCHTCVSLLLSRPLHPRDNACCWWMCRCPGWCFWKSQRLWGQEKALCVPWRWHAVQGGGSLPWVSDTKRLFSSELQRRWAWRLQKRPGFVAFIGVMNLAGGVQ